MQRFLSLPDVSAAATPVPADPTVALSFENSSYRYVCLFVCAFVCLHMSEFLCLYMSEFVCVCLLC